MSQISDQSLTDLQSLIHKSHKILLHLHTSPDPDSFASVFAFKSVLEDMNKQVMVISESGLPHIIEFFPDQARSIRQCTFSEALSDRPDLFICLDSAVPHQISKSSPPEFPLSVPTINIDHHLDNSISGSVNIICESASTTQVLFDLFSRLQLPIKPQVATLLYLGMYADSNGFEYPATSVETFAAAEKLVRLGADYLRVPHIIKSLPNPMLRVLGYCLLNIREHFDGRVIISKIPYPKMLELGLDKNNTTGVNKLIARYLNLSRDGLIVALIYGRPDGRTGISFRSDNPAKYFNIQPLGVKFNGGGHPGASSGDSSGSLDEAEDQVIKAIAELYPELGPA